jgi:hypothetical protein
MPQRFHLRAWLLAAATVCLPAQATAYVCQGVVKGLSVDTSGHLLVQSVGTSMNWPRFCSVGQEANGVAPAACKAFYATLLTAQTTGRPVTVWVHGDANDTNLCASLVPWQFVEGFYFLTLGE